MNMADAPTNPFRNAQQQAGPSVDDSALYPLAASGQAGGGVGLGQALGQRVKDMQLGKSLKLATPRAAELSVKDLNDLAAEFAGVPATNPKLGQLSLEDLNSIEAVFTDAKIQAAQAVRQAVVSGAGAPDVSVSCCCCTPCCSCAASEPVPFD
jgi:hypothetical protein